MHQSLRVHPEVVIHREDPYPAYARLRALGPVVPALDGSVLVVGHAAVSAALKDPRLELAVPYRAAFQVEGTPLPAAIVSFSNGADHARRRGFIARWFQPRLLAELAPRIAAEVDELLGAVARRRRIDAVEALALPLPVRVIGALLGVPREAHADCVRWSQVVAPIADVVLPTERFAAMHAAGAEFGRYLRALMEARRRQPEADLISELVARIDSGGELSEVELVANVMNVFVAGHETTTNLISSALVLVSRHPEVRAALDADPALWPAAIEEVLRLAPPLQFVSRRAREDLALEGTRVAAGTAVHLMLAAANRDPEVFDRPDRLELKRTGEHLSFGGGTHFCVGAPLARMEAAHALSALSARFPRWGVIDEPLELRDTVALRGYRAVPLRLR